MLLSFCFFIVIVTAISQVLYVFKGIMVDCFKNAENDYLDQRLGWAAPKRWSKYTTIDYEWFNRSFDSFKKMQINFFYLDHNHLNTQVISLK